MRTSSSVIGIALLTLVIAGLFLAAQALVGSEPPEPIAPSKQEAQPRQGGAAETKATRMPSRAAATVAAEPLSCLIIKCRATSKSVPGVMVRRLEPKIGHSFDLASAPLLGTSDELGVVEVPVSFVGQLWVGGAPNLAATVETISEPGQKEVFLDTGYPLTVRCTTNSGADVAGCYVSASPAPIHFPPVKGPSLGDPRSGAALWTAVSDAAGRAVIPNLPTGNYNIVASSSVSCSQNTLREIRVPGVEVDVQVASLLGIVVGDLSGSEIIWRRFSVDRSAYATGPCAMTRKGELEKALEERFPGCAAYVGFVKEHAWQEVRVQVIAVLADGSEGSLEWALKPIDQIEGPVYLERDPSSKRGMGLVEVEIYSGDFRIDDIPIQLARYRSREFYRIDESDATFVPAGTYAIQTQATSLPFLSRVLEEQEVVVEANASQVVRVDLPPDLACVDLVPIFLHDASVSRVWIQVEWSGGGMSGGETYLNWSEKERGKLRTYVPTPATIKVSAGGDGLHTATLSESVSTGKAVTIRVPLASR